MNELKFLGRVEPQIESAVSWYESQGERLREQFLQELERILGVLRENPRLFPVVYNRTRRARLRRFPYKVYYRMAPGVVTVVSVVHDKQRPRRW